MINEVQEILINESEIQEKVKYLAEQINKDYAGKDIVLMIILKGSVVFSADLMRYLNVNVSLDFMQVSSYGGSSVSGELKILKDGQIDVNGKNVIIAEDIIDSGNTLSALVKLLKKRGANVEICTLLSKPARRETQVDVKYEGFEIPDEFVVGYGMDYDEKFRNLPYIGILKEKCTVADMKALLVAVNAKYIHTSLSVRTLKAYANSDNVEMAEYTINERVEDILRSIFLKKTDVVLFSCYIWNVEVCLDVADMLKKVSPETKIIFGGPEVSFDDTEYMQKYDFIDAIMRGEGEATFKEWLEIGEMADGITYRENGEIIRNKDRELIHDITSIPFPYTDEDIEKNSGKLIYYESSRGCPFRCSYCLSSTTHSVRFRDMDVVKEELMFFVRHNVRIVKFVDRTFNADRKRTCELVKFLIDNAKNTTFHFEVAADLINDELVELFKTAPEGLFQLEIGVQSTNDKTIKAIDRKTDFEMIKRAVKLVQKAGGVHMHLDLIVGLPFEDFNSFGKSFDDVFNLRPDVLQLGFLKLLRGTKIRSEEEKYGYRYNSKPPYEVLKNDFISYEDVLLLKGIEEVFERYYNSGVFKGAMEYLLEKYNSPFEMFKKLWLFYDGNGYNKVGQSRNSLYEILSHFCDDELFCDILKLDYFTYNKGVNSPKWSLTKYDRSILKTRFDILTDEFIAENLSEYADIPTKETVKYLQFETFEYDVLSDCEKRRNIIIFDNKYNRRIRVCKDLKQ